MNKETLIKNIREIPNFPIPGILFYDVVLLHDDLLATGGAMKAACALVKKLHPKKTYVNFIIELKELNGIALFENDKEVKVESILSL